MNKMSADDENHQNRLNFVPGISKATPAEPEHILQISAPSEVKVTPGEDSLGEEEDRESLVTTPELEEDINDIEPVAVPPLLPLITSGISDFEKIWGEENKENIMAERNEQQDEPPPGLLLMKADSINANTVFVNPATFQRVNPPVPQQLATTGATAISNPLQLMTTAASGSSNMQQLVSSGSSNMQQLVSAASQLISSPSSSLPVLIPAPSHSRPLTAIKQQQPLNAVNQYPSIVGIGYGVPIQQQQTGFQQQQTGLEEQQLTGYQHQQEEEEDYTKYCQDITPPVMLQRQTQRGVKRQSVDSEPSYDLQYSTKEETENSNSSYGGGESYTVGVQDALEGYSGGGGGQEGYNNYVMPGTSTGVQQDFNEQLDAKLAGQIANIMQTKINSKTFSGFEPSPSGEDISVKDYPGVHNFEVKFSKQSTKSKHWDYSKKLNKLFIDMNKWVQVEFKIGSDPPPDLTIRTLPVYTDPSSRREPVKRCPIHANTEEKTNNDFSYPHHIIRYQNDKTMYDEDMKSGRLFSLFEVSTPHKGTDTISRMIKFMCLGSDPGGINRRPIKVVFTLECEGRVLGRRCLDVRVCSCPKRDLQQEENKAAQQEIQVKRISEKVKPALSVSERLQSVLDPPSSKRRRMDDGNSTNNGVIIMVPVHSDDFRKINELVESAWICREPDKQQQIKDTRFRLLQEHNTEILEAATNQLKKSGNSSKS